jgi:signal transduction histidine kinase
LGKNFAYRDYFRGLSQNWQPYVSEVFQRMAEPRRIVVGIAVPIRDRNQRVLGGIVLQLRLEEVTQWVKQIGVGEHGYVFLIDHNGHVAAHPKLDLQTRYYEEYASLAPVKAALEGQESTIEYRDPLAQQSMVATFAAVPLAGQRWVVVAQQDRDEAYLPIKRVGWQLGLSGGILAVGAVAVLLVLGRIRQKLQRTNRSLKQLLEVYERHRQLVAFEIHDALAQPLTAAIMNFEALKSASIQGTAAGQDRFDAALELLRDSLAETRRLMSGLRPPILDDFGVLAAVGYLVRESQLATGVEIEWSHQVTFRRLAPPLEITLYRIIHEGLTNALRHSKSERIGIRLTQTGEQIHLVIEDSGCGFNRQQVAASRFGIRGICERAESSGGSAIIDSGPGRGTRVIVELPLVEASEEAQMVEEA